MTQNKMLKYRVIISIIIVILAVFVAFIFSKMAIFDTFSTTKLEMEDVGIKIIPMSNYHTGGTVMGVQRIYRSNVYIARIVINLKKPGPLVIRVTKDHAMQIVRCGGVNEECLNTLSFKDSKMTGEFKLDIIRGEKSESRIFFVIPKRKVAMPSLMAIIYS